MIGQGASKTTLREERQRLALYRQYLPSLELKRRQFLWELNRARAAEAELAAALAALRQQASDWLACLGGCRQDLRGLVRVAGVELEEESVLGLRLPRLASVEVARADYPFLVLPLWVDALADYLARAAELEVARQVAGRRTSLLAAGLRQITQRVNLFEQVLIPSAQAAIRRITIFLGDAERSAVVRGKQAKAKAGRGRRSWPSSP
ncbi:MAG: V-type ATP synthase subunit D [Thermodesulfobacteriota bacterium]